MADDVIECSSCFGEVHPDASRCRHCGASFGTPWYARWSVLLGTGVAVAFFALWGVSAAISNSQDKARDDVDRMLCTEAGDRSACLDYVADD